MYCFFINFYKPWTLLKYYIYILLHSLQYALLLVSNFDDCTVELGYNIIQGTEYFLSLETSVVITYDCNIKVKMRN